MLLSPRIGGAETLAASLAHEWMDAGVTSEIVFVDPGPAQPTSPGTARLKRLRKALVDLEPDIVLAHSAIPNIYARLARPNRVPVVTTLHSATQDFDHRKLRWSERALRHRTSAVIAVSRGQYQEYSERFGRRNLHLVPNGVSPRFTPRTNFATSPTRVLTVGRVVEQKNPTLWADSGTRVWTNNPLVRFEWVGPTGIDPRYSALEHQHADQSLPVRFVGPTTEAHRWMRESDIFFHPADREAHSIVLLEAAVSALPIVCSDQVAKTLPEDLPRETFATGDSDDAVAALNRVIDDYAGATLRALKWAQSSANDWAASSTARRYLDIFDPLVVRRKGRKP
ncbi:glycosyltransferase family 4 protein [Microbacterium schleiferi]|uniref:glycosyltransferase family 4 protein n=1 Tax=Microbacterium schleiferi TaxID=69362 RepID=UPI0035C7A715